MEASEDTGDRRATVLPMLGPDRYVSRLADVPHEELEESGIRGLIVDLDNTLMGFREKELCADHLAWVERAHDRGFKMVMVSNNFTARVTGIAEQLRIPCIPNALKPLPFGVMRAIKMLDMQHEHIAVVGDQLFTDVLAGKLCGLYTVLTVPIESKDFPITRVFRYIEKFMLPHGPR
ncbi:MAG: YqeG family HAD IIIA-type phosphatase [Candidatus Baltobacteraceae bacterium]